MRCYGIVLMCHNGLELTAGVRHAREAAEQQLGELPHACGNLMFGGVALQTVQVN